MVALSSHRISGRDRSTLLFFLSSSDLHGSTPQSDNVTGIRKQLKDEMSAILANAQMVGEDRMANHVALTAAKEREVASFSASSRVKLIRQGLGVEELAAKPAERCGSQSSECKECRKCLKRSSPCMNFDDSLEVRKATQLCPSLLQFHQSTTVLAKRALEELPRFLGRSKQLGTQPQADRLHALNGKSVDFTEVISMTDDVTMTGAVLYGDNDCERHFGPTRCDRRVQKFVTYTQ